MLTLLIMTTLSFAPDLSEVLLRVMETAPQVCRRHQFFVWTQADFQRWLPHKVSICGSYDREQAEVVLDVFNSFPLPEDVTHGLKNFRSELVVAALAAWRRGLSRGVVLSLSSDVPVDALTAVLMAMGYDQILVTGLSRPGRPDELESFFMFTQPHASYGPAELQAMDMLLPSMHMVYQRVSLTERHMRTGRNTSALSPGQAQLKASHITDREREILMWVRDGLSNQQISEQLGISALTVKNHVQKILRKLGASNRAQAVAKAMTMNALGSSSS